ncbi:MAG: MFS transporter [Desulfurococcaceae archaeon]
MTLLPRKAQAMKLSKTITAFAESIADLKEVFKGNVGVIALSWFLFSLTGSLVNPFFAKYAKDLGASDLHVAVMRSLGMLALALSTIPGGLLTDYLGRVKVILIGTACISVAQFLYAVAPDWRFLTAIFVFDYAVHFYQPALTAIVMDSLQRGEEFKGFLGLNIVMAIPGLFMPVIGGVLYDTLGVTGIRLGFALQGIVSITVFVMRAKALKETFKPRDKDLGKIIFELSGYRAVLFRALKLYLFTSILWQVSLGVANTYLAIYVLDVLGLSKPMWGLLSAISTTGTICASLILLRTNPRPERAALYSAVVVSAVQITLALPYHVRHMTITTATLLAASLVMGLASNILNSALSTILTRTLPVEIRGRAIGIQRLLDNFGASAASLVAATLYLGVGYAESFLVSSTVGLLSSLYLYTILLRRWPKERERRLRLEE